MGQIVGQTLDREQLTKIGGLGGLKCVIGE